MVCWRWRFWVLRQWAVKELTCSLRKFKDLLSSKEQPWLKHDSSLQHDFYSPDQVPQPYFFLSFLAKLYQMSADFFSSSSCMWWLWWGLAGRRKLSPWGICILPSKVFVVCDLGLVCLFLPYSVILSCGSSLTNSCQPPNRETGRATKPKQDTKRNCRCVQRNMLLQRQV